MFRTELTNGITLWYDADAAGEFVLRYPDGVQVRTTWHRLGRIETMLEQLREVYEYLLARAGGDAATDAGPPVEKLVQLDDLLFELSRRPVRRTPVPGQSPGTRRRSAALGPLSTPA